MLGQSRRTQRYIPKPDPEEDNLTAEIRMLSLKHPRYGYKRITACLKRSGWKLNRKRVLRIWRREGLKVPIRKRQEVAPLALRTDAPRGLSPARPRRAPQPRLVLRLCLTSAPRTAGRCGS